METTEGVDDHARAPGERGFGGVEEVGEVLPIGFIDFVDGLVTNDDVPTTQPEPGGLRWRSYRGGRRS